MKAGALAIVAPTFLRSAFAQDRRLFVNTWGGAYTDAETEAFYRPFGKAEGVQVEGVTPVSFAKFKAQVQSKVYDFDVVSTNSIDYAQGLAEGLLEPVDLSEVDKSQFAPDLVEPFGVKSFALSTCLCYRTDRFAGNAPKTWADFFDVKTFPGNRGMIDRAYTALAIALIADGVAPKDVYPLDINRAFAKLDQLKPHIKSWWSQGAQSQQLIRDGEVDVQPMWNGRCQELIDRGLPIAMRWEGAELFMSYWMVPKGDPRAKLAWKFVNFASQPKPASLFGSRMYYGPGNLKAYDHISTDVRVKMPTAPANIATSFEPDTKWLTPKLADINERWLAWQAK